MLSKYHATSRTRLPAPYFTARARLWTFRLLFFPLFRNKMNKCERRATRDEIFCDDSRRIFYRWWGNKLRKSNPIHTRRILTQTRIAWASYFTWNDFPLTRKFLPPEERGFHFPQINRILRLLRQLVRLHFPSSHLVWRTVFFASSVSHILSIRDTYTPIPKRFIVGGASKLPFLNSNRLDPRVSPWNHPWRVAPLRARSRGLLAVVG